MAQKPLISVVSPVYGCRDCLRMLAEKTKQAFAGTDLNWELVLVDDCAPDIPWPIIEELAANDSRIRGIRLTRNHGQHLAIWAGLEAAKGDWVAVIDCDLQDDPVIIPTIYQAALEQQVEAMVVDRGTWRDSMFRRAASRMFYRAIDVLAGVKMNNNIGNFGIYSRRLVDILLLYGEKEVFLPFVVAMTGLKRAFYSIDRSERAAGESSYDFRRLVKLAITITIRFSDRPLKLSVLIGLAFSSISALISFVILIMWFLGAFTVTGWTSLILSVWFLSGLILAVLGVHGFYLGRVFSELQNRPRILVEQTTDDKVFAVKIPTAKAPVK